MARVTPAAALEAQRKLLIARLEVQRGELIASMHHLRGPVQSVNHLRNIFHQVSHFVPMVVLGGSLVGSLFAMRKRARAQNVPPLAPPSASAEKAAGVRRGSFVAVVLAGWRLWNVARVIVPGMRATMGAMLRPGSDDHASSAARSGRADSTPS